MGEQITSGIIEYLVAIRKQKNMTQQDIAEASGMQRPNVARIESNSHVISMDALMRYADALGYKVRFSLEPNNGLEIIEVVNTELYEGERLLEFAKGRVHGMRQRNVFAELMRHLEDNISGKITALYGLRRTGKTVLMQQAIVKLMESGKKAMYMSLSPDCGFNRVIAVIRNFVAAGGEYIFLDEITAVEGFAQNAAILADDFGGEHVNIVIAGTDSLVLAIARDNTLYDRMNLISTTYIGYSEYHNLFPDAGIFEYIHSGGIMPLNHFYCIDEAHRYIEAAIVDNIINSLRKNRFNKRYIRLLELDERGLLHKAIEQAIYTAGEELTINAILGTFNNPDFGSARQLFAADPDADKFDAVDESDVEERLRYALRLVRRDNSEFDIQYLEELTDFLYQIDVIKYYTIVELRESNRFGSNRCYSNEKSAVLFMQPGLRYRQAEELVKALISADSFNALSAAVKERFIQKVMENVEGQLLEHEVILHTMERLPQDYRMAQLRYNNGEIDMAIYKLGVEVRLYEVKRASSFRTDQSRWLMDSEMNLAVEAYYEAPISERTVIYSGENTYIQTDELGTINYRNLDDFLQERY